MFWQLSSEQQNPTTGIGVMRISRIAKNEVEDPIRIKTNRFFIGFKPMIDTMAQLWLQPAKS